MENSDELLAIGRRLRIALPGLPGLPAHPGAQRTAPASALRRALAIALARGEHWEQALTTLSTRDLAVLQHILERGGKRERPADLFQSIAHDRLPGAPSNPRTSVDALTEAGFLLPGTDGSLRIPDEAGPTLLAWVNRQMPRVQAKDLGTVFPEPNTPAEVVESLARLLGALRHPIPMTRDGLLYRRWILHLQDLLGPSPIPGNPDADAELTFAPTPRGLQHASSWIGYPGRLAAFLAVMATLGLLQIDEDTHAAVTSPDVAGLLDGDPWTLYRIVAQGWLHLMDRFCPGAAFRIRALPANTWVPVTAIVSDPSRSMLRLQLPALLAMSGYHLGLFHVALGPEDAICIRLSDAALSARPVRDDGPPPGWPVFASSVWVQGSFEILTPPYLHPGVWYDLLLLAQPVHIDRASTLRLTEKAFAGHEDADLAPLEAVALLRSHANGPIPQAVDFTLETWAGKRSGVHLRAAVALELDTPEAGTRLRPLLEQAGYTPQELAPTLWLLPLSAGAWLRTVGPKQGLSVRGERFSDPQPSRHHRRFARDLGADAAALEPMPRAWFGMPWPGPSRPIPVSPEDPHAIQT